MYSQRRVVLNKDEIQRTDHYVFKPSNRSKPLPPDYKLICAAILILKRTLFFLFCVLVFFTACQHLTTDRAKTVEIFSRSIDESIKKKCFIGFFNLIANSDSCKIRPDIINCWAEEGWKFENVYFRTEQTRMPFDNFFIKIKGSNFNVQYKRSKWHKWERAGTVIEPDLGFYLQVEDYHPTDTVLVKIYSLNDASECLFKLQKN